MSYNYGFYDEIKKKYGNSNAFKYCTDLFNYLGIAALIDGKIFCIHSGLSQEITSIDQISLIDRLTMSKTEGAFVDLTRNWPD